MTAARGPLYLTHFRRRREGRTDYANRLALLKGGQPRLVVRKTNRYVLAQFVSFDAWGDRTLSSCNSLELREMGFPGKRNTPSAYLAGLRAAVRAKAKGVSTFVLDIGRHSPSKGSVLFAALQGALDAGLKAPHGAEVLPKPERIAGKHLSSEVQKSFDSTKQKILSEAGGTRVPAPAGA
jgi:large subunit ribosomal protein L18